METLIKAIQMIDEAVSFAHVQNFAEEAEAFKKIVNCLADVQDVAIKMADESSDFGNIFAAMMAALNNRDMILLSDYLESGLKPLIASMLEPADSFETTDYCVEPTETGVMTVKDKKVGIYLHSNVNPVAEAKTLVAFAAESGAKEYAVFGLGLGFHVKALSDYFLGSVDITVYEEDEELIELCKRFGVKEIFDADNITIVHDRTGKLFSDKISSGSSILMHYPSVCKIENSEARDAMKAFFLNWNTTVQKRRELFANFVKNCSLKAPNVATLKENFEGKEIIYVGGGPSLMTSVDFIKDNRKNLCVICATTVLKKLMDLGIDADYAIVLDPNERTYGHMQGISDCKVPLIFAATAYWKFAAYSKGERYIAYQEQYKPSVEAAAKENVPVFATGGSVTTIALSIAAGLGAKKIYLAGVDMGFPGGKTHADGTMDATSVSEDGLIPIKSVKGDIIYTEDKLLSYLKWIEREIEKHPEVDYINLSDCGAFIKGCKHINI